MGMALHAAMVAAAETQARTVDFIRLLNSLDDRDRFGAFVE
jgi:hypothetical protein